VGLPEHWKVAFKNGNIRRLRETLKAHWENISNCDSILFYTTDPAKCVIRYGVVAPSLSRISLFGLRRLGRTGLSGPTGLSSTLLAACQGKHGRTGG